MIPDEPHVLVPVSLLVEAANLLGFSGGMNRWKKCRDALDAAAEQPDVREWLCPLAAWAERQLPHESTPDSRIEYSVNEARVTAGHLRALVECGRETE